MRLFLLTCLFLVSLSSLAQVAAYTFTSADPGNQPSKAVTTKDANVTASDITRGTGIASSAAAGSINATGWNSSAQDANDYYEFTLTPSAGHQLTLTAISATVRKSTAGPLNYLVSYSIGGVETTATSGTIAMTNNADVAVNASLSINTAQPVRFRIYAWGAPTATGTFRIDNTLTVTGAAPLPVKLLSFNGVASANSVVLNWSTSWEDRNEGFDILKSQSAKVFEKVGFIEGNSTTDVPTNYSFVDTNIEAGQVYYYKLRQRDIGGGSILSTMVAVRVETDVVMSQPVIYPNPSRGQFSLSWNNTTVSAVKLYNGAGAEVPITVVSGLGSSLVALETTVPPGLYYLKMQKTDGMYASPLKVIIQ